MAGTLLSARDARPPASGATVPAAASTGATRRRVRLNVTLTKPKVPPAEVMHLSRQLAAFVGSGVPILAAVTVLSETTPSPRLRDLLRHCVADLQQGQPFSDALARDAAIFPPYYLGIVRSAELTGRLDLALEQLSAYLERDLEARSKVRSALVYPAIVLVLSLVTMALMIGFVLPRFTRFFRELDAELPVATQLLIGVGDAVQRWWFIAPAGLVAAAAVWWWARSTRVGRAARDRLLLRLPLVGPIVRLAAVERACRVLGAMMRAGVPLLEGLTAASEASTNVVYRRALLAVREGAMLGEGVTGPIASTGLFPAAAVQMIRVGEHTGTLDTQLDAAGRYYAAELEHRLKRLTTLFEPAVIVCMGLVVGFVAVALVSAMYGALGSSRLR